MTLTLIFLAIGAILLFTLPVQPDGSGRGLGKGGMSALRAFQRLSGNNTPLLGRRAAAPNTPDSPRGPRSETGSTRGPGTGGVSPS